MIDGQYAALIPARSGASGLRKNLAELQRKGLLQRAIESFQQLPQPGRTIVATRADNTSAAAIYLGGKVPFPRPADLAKDDSPQLDAWKQSLLALKTREGHIPGTILRVSMTAPRPRPQDTAQCLKPQESQNDDPSPGKVKRSTFLC